MLEPHQLLGPYRIERMLGQGGMGIVYAATHQGTGAEVVLKVLRRELAEQTEFIERMVREARAAAALRHPNIVTTYDFVLGGPATFIVMERLAGETLGARLGRERLLAPATVAKIGASAFAALAAAHDAGLVHRDVKPDNVFLVHDASGRETVKLLDFGLVKSLGDDAKLTKSDAILGTLQYMAPEQARGESIDGRADVYAAGSTLYFALTGMRTYQAARTDATSFSLLPIPAPPIQSLRPEVPRELARIVERAIDKDLLRRYAKAADVARELEAWLASVGEPIEEAPPTTLAVPTAPMTTLGPSGDRDETEPFERLPVVADLDSLAPESAPLESTRVRPLGVPGAGPPPASPAVSHTLVSPRDVPPSPPPVVPPGQSATLEMPFTPPPEASAISIAFSAPPPLNLSNTWLAPGAMPPPLAAPRPRRGWAVFVYALVGIVLFALGLLGGRFLWAQ